MVLTCRRSAACVGHGRDWGVGYASPPLSALHSPPGKWFRDFKLLPLERASRLEEHLFYYCAILDQVGSSALDIDDDATDFGFHRVIGGQYYGMVLDLAAVVLGLLSISLVVPLFFPYPEIMGYTKVVQGLFGFLFGLFDAGTGGVQGDPSRGMIRFISQYARTDTRRAFAYVRFFVGFQMVTGLVQVTIVAIYVLVVVVHMEFAHLAWFMLGYSVIQWPGMLQVFESALDGFQDFGKKGLVSWMRDSVFSVACQVTFVLVGREWGHSVPAAGEMVGMTLGYVVSLYAADFFGFFYGAHYFFNLSLVKVAGIKFRDLFRFRWSEQKGVARDSFSFVGRMWAFGQALGLVGLLVQVWTISALGAYAAWMGLIQAAGILGNLTDRQAPMMSKAMSPFSEAYNYGKRELARWYVHNLWKWYASTTLMVAIPVVVLLPGVLANLVGAIPGLAGYAAVVYVVPVLLLKNAFGPLNRLSTELLVAAHEPNKRIVLDYVMAPVGWLTLYLTLGVLRLGWLSLVLSELVPTLCRIVVSLAWIQRKVLRIDYRGISWQAFVAPGLAAVPYALIMIQFSLLWDFWASLFTTWGFTLFVVLGVWLLFEVVFWSPLLALFGGWDDETLAELERGAKRKYAGPSTPLLRAIFRTTAFFCRVSPLHGRFPFRGREAAAAERAELASLMVGGRASNLDGAQGTEREEFGA
ncbi:MAG: hypothetical protein Kow0069_26370 [Promethearchaeota archaeon]